MKIKAVVKAKNGIWHALTWSHADDAVCGWEPHNFNKRVSLEYERYSNGYEYVPPNNLFPTCIVCVVIAARQ